MFNSSRNVCSARMSAWDTKSDGPLTETWSCSTSLKSRSRRLDAFCAAFSTAEAAVAAAVAAQRALTGQDWPTKQPIGVRMALHTGACDERDNDYFGPPVNRVARLESVAHGG